MQPTYYTVTEASPFGFRHSETFDNYDAAITRAKEIGAEFEQRGLGTARCSYSNATEIVWTTPEDDFVGPGYSISLRSTHFLPAS